MCSPSWMPAATATLQQGLASNPDRGNKLKRGNKRGNKPMFCYRLHRGVGILSYRLHWQNQPCRARARAHDRLKGIAQGYPLGAHRVCARDRIH